MKRLPFFPFEMYPENAHRREREGREERKEEIKTDFKC